MNKQQLKNLKIGRDYLMDNVTDEQFDMNVYLNSCKTIGCALGWMTLSPKLMRFKSNDHGFLGFGRKAFGSNFTYGSDYVEYDNTRLGAIGRIDVILKYPDLFE